MFSSIISSSHPDTVPESRANIGNGFSRRLLCKKRQDGEFIAVPLCKSVGFCHVFPNIFHTASGKSSALLSWSHYRALLQENNEEARNWYVQETANAVL